MDASVSYWKSFGTKFCVPRFEGEPYLIGVKVATFLKRETFNMYRSMKIKNILVKRATIEQVEFLVKSNIVRVGTHSVTLIPFEDGMYFLADAWIRMHKSNSPYSRTKSKRATSFLKEKPKLHRRKAAAWEVQKSLGREDVRRRILPDAFETASSMSTSHLFDNLLEASLEAGNAKVANKTATKTKTSKKRQNKSQRKASPPKVPIAPSPSEQVKQDEAPVKSAPASPKIKETKEQQKVATKDTETSNIESMVAPTAEQLKQAGLFVPFYCEKNANLFNASSTPATHGEMNYNLPPYYYSQQHPLSKIPRWTFLNYATTTT